MQPSRWELFSQMLIHAWIKNLTYSKQIKLSVAIGTKELLQKNLRQKMPFLQNDILQSL